MMIGPCEHCPNPDKALWQSECLYKGLYPSHRAFVSSNFDAPCVGDQYDDDKRAQARDIAIKASLITLIVAIGLALIFVGIRLL